MHEKIYKRTILFAYKKEELYERKRKQNQKKTE